MSFKDTSIDAFLGEARTVITNGRAQSAIATALALYGYNEARLDAGEALLVTAEARQADREREFSEQLAATQAVVEARQATHKQFMAHRQLARLALKNLPVVYHDLGLPHTIKRTRTGWLRQAGQFYDKLLGDETAVAAMGTYNITTQMLEAGQEAVQEVVALDNAQDRERAEAQQATRERDAAFEALDDWLSEYLAVARIALVDQPQLLEALGIVVK